MAEDLNRRGPQIGEPFPGVLLPDQQRVLIDLHRARNDRQALVVFYRSARW